MACTLVARGKHFDVESFLARTKLPLKKAHCWIRGTQFFTSKRRYLDSGFSEWVSHDRWDNLRAALRDVLKYLRKHRAELLKLKRTKGVESIDLDFGFNSRVGTKNVAVQGEYLSPDLLMLAGELNMGIALSIYPPFLPTKAKRKTRKAKKSP